MSREPWNKSSPQTGFMLRKSLDAFPGLCYTIVPLHPTSFLEFVKIFLDIRREISPPEDRRFTGKENCGILKGN